MAWIGTVVREILGLFVDDGRFALTLLAWVGVAWLALPRIGAPAAVTGLILFVGLVAILAESVTRRARRR